MSQGTQDTQGTLDMSFNKTPWRQENVRWVGQHKRHLCGSDGKLKYAYIDLFGDSGEAMHAELVKAKLLPNGKTDLFVGLDNEPEHLLKYILRQEKAGKEPDFRLVFGNAYSVVPNMLRKKEPLGIVALDTTNGINPRWWTNHVDSLQELVRLGSAKCDRFLLLLNHVLDRGGEADLDAMGRIGQHADHLVQTFKPWSLQKNDLLPGAEQVSETGFLGFAGGFEIYRSGNKALRMVTVRLAFDGRNKRTTVYRGS
jgi:hypothetical protein